MNEMFNLGLTTSTQHRRCQMSDESPIVLRRVAMKDLLMALQRAQIAETTKRIQK